MPLAQRRRRSLIAAAAGGAAALFGLVIFLIIVVLGASGRIADLNAGRATQDAQIQGLAGAVDSARAQIQSLGATPVVPAPSVILKTVEVTGAAGAQGPGPSDQQVAAAVSAYLEVHPPPGVSSAEVASAVDAYFKASPAPSGPQGPGPSQQEIADAVASYMAANPAPSGPPGKDGSPGQDGAPGSPPAGWSWTDSSGTTYDCVMDDGTPAPHYTCNPAAASPSPSGTPTTPAADTAAQPLRTTGTPSAASAAPTGTPTATAPAPTPTGPASGSTGGSSPLSRILLSLTVPVLRRDTIYLGEPL